MKEQNFPVTSRQSASLRLQVPAEEPRSRDDEDESQDTNENGDGRVCGDLFGFVGWVGGFGDWAVVGRSHGVPDLGDAACTGGIGTPF